MNILIVDDEPHSRKTIEKLVESSGLADEIRTAGSADEAFDAIQQKMPDLVLLDIQMPGQNGFDLLARFDKPQFAVIFITAFDNFAIRAIKFSASDYLLKPVDSDELLSALARVAESKTSVSGKDKQWQTLLENIGQPLPRKLAVPDSDGISFVEVDDIIRCDSDGNYTKIYLKDGKRILASKTLGEYEDLLGSEKFFRVHRSHLISLSHIKRYIRGEGGYVELSDGSKVEVSRRKKNEFMDRIHHL